MKKLIYVFLFVVIGFYSFSFAYNEFSYENAKSLAKDYITNSSFDENWKDKKPTIVGEGKYFYTDSEDSSYVEFKVSCDNNPSCGFIMVNFDGDDVTIPIASTSGNTPSEVLSAKNGDNGENNKLYYFSPFEQYAENEVTGDVSSIDPQDDYVSENSGTGKTSKELKKESRNKFLKDKIVKSKDEAKKFKKSPEFKKLKKELKDKKQTNGKDEVSFKYLPFEAYAQSTETIGNSKYVGPSNNTTNCNSRIPCYQQFSYNYPSGSCLSGCSPTAVAMLFGYHDRALNYQSLVSGTATDYIINSTTDSNITSMINSIRTYIGTYCDSNGLGATSQSNIKNAYNYAVAKGYNNTTGTYSTGSPSALLTIIKAEIDKGNPIIIGTSTHSLVAYGYNTTSGSQIVRVNYGWGNGSYSNADVNINSININGTSYAIINTTRFDIK